MAETAGKSPGFAKAPDYDVHLEPSPRRLRVMFNGETVADSINALLLYESRHIPVYYFPMEDIRAEFLPPTEERSFCPFKGHASYWSVSAGGKVSENALWSYATPYDEVPALAGYGAFYWNRVDHWSDDRRHFGKWLGVEVGLFRQHSTGRGRGGSGPSGCQESAVRPRSRGP